MIIGDLVGYWSLSGGRMRSSANTDDKANMARAAGEVELSP